MTTDAGISNDSGSSSVYDTKNTCAQGLFHSSLGDL